MNRRHFLQTIAVLAGTTSAGLLLQAFNAIDSDGKLDLPSLQDQQDYFLQGGFQSTRLDLTKIVDMHYADQAAAKLGPYT